MMKLTKINGIVFSFHKKIRSFEKDEAKTLKTRQKI